MTNDSSREGGDPPNHKTKRRSRRLTGPGRQALEDLSLILFIFAAELDDKAAAAALRGNIVAWKAMYL